MNKPDHALGEFRQMDQLAAGDSPLHRLHPLVKLLTTVLYIVLVMSFGKYQLSALCAMLLWPAGLFAVSGISIGTCLYKLRVVLPLVCAVGITNPFFDKAPMLYLGDVAISGGVISMVTLMLKGLLCLTASFLLIASTPMDSICAALRKLHLPAFGVTLLLLTYRYISTMLQELSIMSEAYHLRAPLHKGIRPSAWGSFIGQLFLRSMDRAENIYSAMQLRGFKGDFPYADPGRLNFADWLYLPLAAAFLLFLRICDLPALIGSAAF